MANIVKRLNFNPTGGSSSASGITYDNDESGLTATNVQAAIDELVVDDQTESAARIAADNTLQGNIDTEEAARIAADSDLQAEIEELEAAIAALPEPIYYAGTWNASTNTPTLANSDSGVQGELYYVTVAGTVDFGAGNISFSVGDKVVNNGTTWDKWDNTDDVNSVFGRTGLVVAESGDYSANQITNTPSGNLEATNLQSAVNELQTDIDNLNTDLQTVEDDLDQEIIDRQSADSDLQSQIDLKAAETDLQDEITRATTAEDLIQDNLDAHINDIADAHDATAVSFDGTTSGLSANNVQDAVDELAARPAGSPGDIQETIFTISNNQSSAADVTGFSFDVGVVRSFNSIVSVSIDSDSDVFEEFEINGIQKSSTWDISISSTGDDSGVEFQITDVGQIQYTCSDYAGFASGKIAFRAIVTGV